MRILIAPDAFKGSLTATDAAMAIRRGIASAKPDAEMICMPLADGGEGTLAVLQPMQLSEHVGIIFEDGKAWIESACFVGLQLNSMQGDVFGRGSGALGEAVGVALDAGVKEIYMALGGSAVVDGGLGLLLALGCRVLDDDGVIVSADLKGLMQARCIDLEGLDPRLKQVQIIILSDVQSPLCGAAGAVYMFGAQKGVEAGQSAAVEAAMQAWADLCERAFGLSLQAYAGAGAAGGLGFALGLLGGKMVSGAEYVMQRTGFDAVLPTVDWVVTGEGLSDAQTMLGKLPYVVAKAAYKAGVRVALISGDVSNKAALLECFDAVVAARPSGVSDSEAMRHADRYLSAAAADWAECLEGAECVEEMKGD